MSNELPSIEQLVQSAAGGSQQALGSLLDIYRERLLRVIHFRMSQHVQARVAPSDVLQETFIEAARRVGDYAEHPSVSFFVWLRFLAVQQLKAAHRRHLATKGRDARRDISIDGSQPMADASLQIADMLLASGTSPSGAVAKLELRLQVLAGLEALEPIDREVLVLRHIEQLTNVETAQTLGISVTAANNRYVRALERFRIASPAWET